MATQKRNMFRGRGDVPPRLKFAIVAGSNARGLLGMAGMGLGVLGGIGGASIDEPRAIIYFWAGPSGGEAGGRSPSFSIEGVDAGNVSIGRRGIGRVREAIWARFVEINATKRWGGRVGWSTRQ